MHKDAQSDVIRKRKTLERTFKTTDRKWFNKLGCKIMTEHSTTITNNIYKWLSSTGKMLENF